MINSIPLRSGPTWLVRVPADPAHAISPGDLLGLHNGQARPAAATPWEDDADTTRENFAAGFLGVAHSASPAGDAGPVSVDIGPAAVYAPACEPGGFAFGQPVGPADDGGALSNVRLAPAGTTGAVGRAVEAAPAAAGRVRASFASAFCTAANHRAGQTG